MKTRLIHLLLLVPLLTLISCGSATLNNESPTRGDIRISVEESYTLILDTEIATFEATYADALIRPSYKSEAECFADLLNDSVRLIVVNRMLTPEEDAALRAMKLNPRTTKIAYDGLAFIVNRSNPDSNLRSDQIEGIFKGSLNDWSMLNKKNAAGEITVVFDNAGSGNPRYIREKFGIKGAFPKNCFAVNSNPEVISYVEKTPGALGIISVNWISDRDDTLSNNFMKRVQICGIGGEAYDDGTYEGRFYKPYQAYIADGSYPFTREVYTISRETFSGLGTGFVQFLAGEIGQRIILKSGLVPATMPIRIVAVKNQ